MSQGIPCKCEQRNRPVKDRNWRILNYKCNYSAFNGYHYTPSDYSSVTCDSCGAVWRTKAAYTRVIYYDPKNKQP